MHTIYLALGSNISDRHTYIKNALKFLRAQITLIDIAPIYESHAVGFENQPNFFNTVISCTTDLSPLELLVFIKEVEKSVGREERFHWGPREIDIDILFYDNIVYKDDTLIIPHMYIADRDFVLIPLCDIAPLFVHPLLHKTITELANLISNDKKSIVSKINF